jgi:hypothetical protein
MCVGMFSRGIVFTQHNARTHTVNATRQLLADFARGNDLIIHHAVQIRHPVIFHHFLRMKLSVDGQNFSKGHEAK